MHRMKIGLIAAIVLLALTAGLYVVVTRELKESVVQDLDTDGLARAADSRRRGPARGDGVREPGRRAVSTAPAVVGVFDKSDENSRRQAAFEQCEQINAQLRTGGKPQGRHRRDARFVGQGAGARSERQRDVRRGPALEVPRGRHRAVGQGDQGHLDAAGPDEPRRRRADHPAGRHDPRRAAGRLRADGARRAGQARPARHRGRATSTTARSTPPASSPRGPARTPRRTATRPRR